MNAVVISVIWGVALVAISAWGLACIFGVFRPQLPRINRENENAYHARMSLASMTPEERRAEQAFWARPNEYKYGKLMTPAERRAEQAFWDRPNQYKDGKLID